MIESLAFVAMAAAGPNDIPDSQYRGWHYESEFEPVRKCIYWRESRGRWRADGPYGSGAAQWIQSTWDHYAAESDYPEWVGIRPFNAPRYVQDEIFWVMINPFPKRKTLHGAHHWSPRHAMTIGKRIKNCVEESR